MVPRGKAAPGQSTLTPAVFYLLLALSEGERHGYELMKKVTRDSGGAVQMGPGTLYGSIKRMLKQALIEETDERPDSVLGDERRRYYRITEAGRTALTAELRRFACALDVAAARRLVKGTVVKRVKSATL
jgi:DNA-binding PadR family transcriptional regulator